MFKESELSQIGELPWDQRIGAMLNYSNRQDGGGLAPQQPASSFGNGGFPDFNQWIQMRYNANPLSAGLFNAQPPKTSGSQSQSNQEETTSKSNRQAPNFNKAISNFESALRDTPSFGKGSIEGIMMREALERAKKDRLREAWRDMQLESGRSVVIQPVAHPNYGPEGRVVGFDI